jgi:hypothetical protein
LKYSNQRYSHLEKQPLFMNENIHRVKKDLETICAAAGFGEPPLGREDVSALRLAGGFGLLWAICASLVNGLPLHWFTIFALVASLGGMAAYHIKFVRSSERTVTRERVYRGSWWLGIVLGVLIGGFYIWAKFYGGLRGTTFIGANFLFSGALLVVLAITDRWRLLFWGWAIPIVLFGASVQFLSEPMLAILLGLVICIGGFASAQILSWQLRQTKNR